MGFLSSCWCCSLTCAEEGIFPLYFHSLESVLNVWGESSAPGSVLHTMMSFCETIRGLKNGWADIPHTRDVSHSGSENKVYEQLLRCLPSIGRCSFSWVWPGHSDSCLAKYRRDDGVLFLGQDYTKRLWLLSWIFYFLWGLGGRSGWREQTYQEPY